MLKLSIWHEKKKKKKKGGRGRVQPGWSMGHGKSSTYLQYCFYLLLFISIFM